MTSFGPGTISKEAADLLAAGDPADPNDMAHLPIADIRQATLETHRAAVEKALKTFQVQTSDITVDGIACMEVVPPTLNEKRQLLYLFGGGFVQGSPFEDLPIIASLAVKTGARVVAPYYRLAPENPFPAALDDITTVARKLLADNANTLLAGESAGGNLSLAAVHRLRAAQEKVPMALALLSPAVDLNHCGDSREADRDPFLRKARTKFVVEAYLGRRDPSDPEISPIYGPFDADFPATFVTSGTRDLLLSDCARLARVMRDAGASVELRIWEGMWHVFEFYPVPEAEASLTEVAAFLNLHFKS